MKKLVGVLLVVLAILIVSEAANALTIQNASFEDRISPMCQDSCRLNPVQESSNMNRATKGHRLWNIPKNSKRPSFKKFF